MQLFVFAGLFLLFISRIMATNNDDDFDEKNRFPHGWVTGEHVAFRINIIDELCLQAIASKTASVYLQQGSSIIRKQRKYQMLNVEFKRESKQNDVYEISAQVPLVLQDSIYRVRVICALDEIEHDGIDYSARFMLSNIIRVRPPSRNLVVTPNVHNGHTKLPSFTKPPQ